MTSRRTGQIVAELAGSPLSGHVPQPPKRGHPSWRALAATCHTVNVAWITGRAELARWLWDLSKITLAGELPFSRGERVSRMECVAHKPP